MKYSIESLKFARQRHKEALERSKISWYASLPEGQKSIQYHENAINNINKLIQEQEC